MKELLDLYLIFFKIGCCTFGGGYAMLPLISRELCEKSGWMTEAEIADYYAIGQMTPGAIAVNISTFAGMKRKGILGAVFSTAGMITPSLIIIMLIAALLSNFSEISAVRHALVGIRAAVLALMAKAIYIFIKNGVKDWFTVLVFLLTILSLFVIKIPSVGIIVLAALAGIFYGRICAVRVKGGKKK